MLCHMLAILCVRTWESGRVVRFCVQRASARRQPADCSRVHASVFMTHVQSVILFLAVLSWGQRWRLESLRHAQPISAQAVLKAQMRNAHMPVPFDWRSSASAEVQRERSRLKLLILLAPSQGHRLLRIYLSEKIQRLHHSQVICRIPGFSLTISTITFIFFFFCILAAAFETFTNSKWAHGWVSPCHLKSNKLIRGE